MRSAKPFGSKIPSASFVAEFSGQAIVRIAALIDV
jgi:hypothetical protein